MILLFHLYQNNTEKATFEIQKFHTDLAAVCSILESLVDVNGRRSHVRKGRLHYKNVKFRLHCKNVKGRLHYKNVSPLLEACIMGDEELVVWLLTRFGASLEDKCTRKNR